MWHVPSTDDSFMVMEVPVTIEFLSSLRSNFQLLTFRNKIKPTTEKPKRMIFQCLWKYFYKNIKTSVKGISIQNWKKGNKIANHRCCGMIFLERTFYLIPAHGIESYFKHSDKGLLSNVKRLPCVLELLLHLHGKNVKCSHKRKIGQDFTLF